MIPDFKTFIKESFWSDMQDRSMGDTVRQEDMITTNEDIRKKIFKLYKEQGKGDTLDVSSLTNSIKCDDFSYLFGGLKEVKHIIGLENWDVSKVTNMKGIFEECENFNANLSNWDVSSVENMSGMFYNCENFNCDLSKWNVSSVEDMRCMFLNCKNFNSDLSKWNVSNVENMRFMFYNCENFNCDLSKWNVSSVEDMENMFDGCKNFNSDLSKWDVHNVEMMRFMFSRCEKFNSDLSKWNISSDKNIQYMFYNCKSLKQLPSWYMRKSSKITESIWSDMQDRSAGKTVREEDMITTNNALRVKIQELYKEQGEGDTLDVSSLTKLIKCDDFSYLFKGYKKVKYIIGLEDWDVSNVKDMFRMFCDSKNFNSDLSKWNVSNVENMFGMFQDCKNFNCDLSNWNVSNVENMGNMFDECINFNSDLSKWDVSNVKYMSCMFGNCQSLKKIPSWYLLWV